VLTTLLFALTAAHAQDTPFVWAASDGGDRYPNAVLADLDGDGLDDLAIGTLARCGAVDVWLSSVDPALGHPTDGRDGWLGPATAQVAPPTCDPAFGVALAAHDGVLGTSPDRGGAPTATVTFVGGRAALTVADTPAAPTADAGCDPCCGPAPCCTTGGGGGGGGVPTESLSLNFAPIEWTYDDE
jgi:hypothetical protein